MRLMAEEMLEMKKQVLILIIFSIFFSQALAAQENQRLVRYYDTELFRINYNMFGGLILYYNSQTSSTQFGISAIMKEALSLYPDSKEYMESYVKLNRTGNILLWGGLVSALAGAYYPLIKYGNEIDGTAVDVKVSLGIAFGGTVSTLVGAFIYEAGLEKLFQSINLYNRYRISEFE